MNDNDSGLSAAQIAILKAASRVDALAESGQMGASPQEAFDEIAAMSALLFRAPVAQVTFLDAERQWMKSEKGSDMREARTESSFCAHTITSRDDVVWTLDAATDLRFSNNPFVTEAPFVRFYAGATVLFREEPIGTVCVYDFAPREGVTTEQITALAGMARQVEGMIDGGHRQRSERTGDG